MKIMRCFGLLIAAFLLAGCTGRVDNSATEPLTLDAWAALPPEKKFEIESYERLKLGNPKLQDDREWKQFERKVVLPAKQKELPKTAKAK